MSASKLETIAVIQGEYFDLLGQFFTEKHRELLTPLSYSQSSKLVLSVFDSQIKIIQKHKSVDSTLLRLECLVSDVHEFWIKHEAEYLDYLPNTGEYCVSLGGEPIVATLADVIPLGLCFDRVMVYDPFVFFYE